MKKVSLPMVVWGLLIAASLSSYLFLASEKCENAAASTSTTEAVQSENELEAKDAKVILPDIALVKKVLNITKIVLPKD